MTPAGAGRKIHTQSQQRRCEAARQKEELGVGCCGRKIARLNTTGGERTGGVLRLNKVEHVLVVDELDVRPVDRLALVLLLQGGRGLLGIQ